MTYLWSQSVVHYHFKLTNEIFFTCVKESNLKGIEQHNKEQAEKHVSLLTEKSEKLLDV